MKKRFLTLFLAILCIFTSTNFIFAVNHCTTYQIQNNAWEQQPQGAPWCFDTCMKIVLRDAQQKNLGNPLDGGFNIPNINAIVEAQVPEEEIVHRVFLDNNTIGEIGTISNASLIHRQAFLRAAWSFCDYYLGNRDIHQRIGATNDSRKTKMLNGLLGVALEDELNNLWGNLDANTRKMIVQDSPQAVLNRIQQDTGVTGNMHNVTFDQAAYDAALRDVVNEIENNNRMVILVFSDVNNPQRSHACIAFVTRRDVTDTTLEELGIFNPWGNYISINQNNYASFFDIGDQASRNWVLSRYVTFNY